MTDQVCSKCGRVLPLDQFPFTSGKYRRKECLQCKRFRMLTATPTLPSTRQCKVCGKVKPISKFPRTVGHYRSHKCRSCLNAIKLAEYYAKRTPEYLAERALKAKARRRARIERILAAVRS